jgi:predicted DNA-binding ribbon-helix-helix protein
MKKRSITVSGHSTSISMEDEFWDVLTGIAQKRNLSLSALITLIDAERTGKNLSSAIRLFILKDLQQKTD